MWKTHNSLSKTSQAFGPETPSSCAPPYWSYKPLEAWSRFATSERPQWNSSEPHPGELKSMKHGLSRCCACHTKIWDAQIYVYQYIHLHVVTKFSKLFMCKWNLNIYIYIQYLFSLAAFIAPARPIRKDSKLKHVKRNIIASPRLRTITVRNWNHQSLAPIVERNS